MRICKFDVASGVHGAGGPAMSFSITPPAVSPTAPTAWAATLISASTGFGNAVQSVAQAGAQAGLAAVGVGPGAAAMGGQLVGQMAGVLGDHVSTSISTGTASPSSLGCTNAMGDHTGTCSNTSSSSNTGNTGSPGSGD